MKVDPVILKPLPSRSLLLRDSSMPGLDGPARSMETREVCTYVHGRSYFTNGHVMRFLRQIGSFVCEATSARNPENSWQGKH